MTDIEKTRKFLNEMDIGFEETKRIDIDNRQIIYVRDHHDKVDSSWGFFFFFEFEPNGTFVQCGARE